MPVIKLHIGDLDRSSISAGKSWNAIVTILVHDVAERAVANATVAAKWSNGAKGTASCVTNSNGICTISKTGLKNTTTSVTFSVTGVAHATLTSQANNNHDPDGDSNGTVIIISRP